MVFILLRPPFQALHSLVPVSFPALSSQHCVNPLRLQKTPLLEVPMPRLMPFCSPVPSSEREQPCFESVNFMNHKVASLSARNNIPICPSIIVLHGSFDTALSSTMCFVVIDDHTFLFRLNWKLCKGRGHLELLLELRQFPQRGSISTDNIEIRIIFLTLVSSALRSSMPKTI